MAALRAKGQPNSNFLGALRNGITHDAEDAGRGEQQRYGGKEADEERIETRLRHG